jgi:hypothetical protein
MMDKEEVQDMIDLSIAEAIKRHNRNASTISAILGVILLGFYSHGLITVVNGLK